MEFSSSSWRSNQRTKFSIENLQQSSDKVVVVSLFDNGTVDVTSLGSVMVAEVIDEHLAVNFGSMGRGTSLPKQVGFFARAFQHYFNLAANPLLTALTADALLELHEFAAASLDFLGRHLVAEQVCGRAFFVGVGENAEPVELCGSDEVAKLLEIAFGFAGKSDDERCSQGDIGNRLAHLCNQLEENLRRAAALHSLEDGSRGVLQGNVDVAAQARVLGKHLQQARRDLVWIGVEEPHPIQVFDLRKLLKQGGEAVLNPKVFAEAGCVLPDEVDFANALRGQSLRFGHNGGDAARTELAAKLRDDAEGAGMITSFCNLDVGGMARRGEQERSIF